MIRLAELGEHVWILPTRNIYRLRDNWGITAAEAPLFEVHMSLADLNWNEICHRDVHHRLFERVI